MQKIVIIGAGIVGAALAYQLGRRGNEVIVIDSGEDAASAASFGWINASYHLTADHFLLRREAMLAWARLEAEMVGVFDRCGAFVYEGDLNEQAASLSSLGYIVEDLKPAAFARRLPGLPVPDEGALFLPEEGATDPVLTARRLLASSGASVLRGVRADALLEQGGTIAGVRVPGGEIAADQVIVAAGVGTPGLLDKVGVPVPLLPRPGITMVSGPMSTVIRPILVTPAGEVRQILGGRLLASTAVNHQGDATDTLTQTPIALAQDAAERISAWVPGQFNCHELRLAGRPFPADGLPVIGQAGPEGLWVAVMHSGVTLAPAVAEMLCAEMLDGRKNTLLRSFRPQRFTT